MLYSSKKANKIAPKLYKARPKKYESSNENMCRSVAVYYSGGIMGKAENRKLYRDSAYKVNNKKLQTTRISIANFRSLDLCHTTSLCLLLSLFLLVRCTMLQGYTM